MCLGVFFLPPTYFPPSLIFPPFFLPFFLVFILLGLLWVFQIYGLKSFIVWGECSAIIFSNISSPHSLFSFWNSNCSYIRLFDIVPQLLDVLGFFPSFFVFRLNIYFEWSLSYDYIFISGISISYFLMVSISLLKFSMCSCMLFFFYTRTFNT